MKFDYVSDLHIDHYDYDSMYIFDDYAASNGLSDTLIVGGDTSNNVNETCDFMKKIACNLQERVYG